MFFFYLVSGIVPIMVRFGWDTYLSVSATWVLYYIPFPSYLWPIQYFIGKMTETRVLLRQAAECAYITTRKNGWSIPNGFRTWF